MKVINHHLRILRQSRAHPYHYMSEVTPERGSIRTSASIRTRSSSTGIALKTFYKHLVSITSWNNIENFVLDNIDNLVEVEEVCGLERLAIVAEAHARQLTLWWSTGESNYWLFF